MGVDPREVRALKLELSALDRPLAKPRVPSWRDVCRSKARAAFVRGVEALLIRGWSKRRIAKSVGCDVHTFEDWLAGNRQVPAWAIHALPVDGRVGYVRAIVDSLPGDDDEDVSEKPLRAVG
jgi:hypothetical protein